MVNQPYISASVNFICICMYLLFNFLYPHLNCSRGNRFCMDDLCETWIFRSGQSIAVVFPAVQIPTNVCTVWCYVQDIFVESWLHLHLISFQMVNLKIQILNLFKNTF